MKFCPNCGTQLEEGAGNCPNCGAVFAQPAPVAYADPTDHTMEFDAGDISENKVYAMLPYVMGILGVIIALIAHNSSDYAAFHVRQFLKLAICEALVGIIAAVLAITIIVPIAAGICLIILLVIRIICFFQVCKGEAKEPALVNKLGFLK